MLQFKVDQGDRMGLFDSVQRPVMVNAAPDTVTGNNRQMKFFTFLGSLYICTCYIKQHPIVTPDGLFPTGSSKSIALLYFICKAAWVVTSFLPGFSVLFNFQLHTKQSTNTTSVELQGLTFPLRACSGVDKRGKKNIKLPIRIQSCCFPNLGGSLSTLSRP